ncbi:hypothetical protein SDC9_116488 [bioreactor metagenome]|uniref:Uncharacterized protein n=1 Tax=bioreactor metagenome TaxID=1076179 RepID=A0A645C2G6_9ZZZZ
MVNVEPLFQFMESGEEYECIDDVVKLLNLVNIEEGKISLLNTIQSLPDLFLVLYQLRDMFRDIRECEITIKRKKGDE